MTSVAPTQVSQAVTPTPSNLMADNGIYHLTSGVEFNSVAPIIKWILEENLSVSKKSHLTLIISSYGGDTNAAFALIDTMRGSTIPVYTVGLGVIASAGLLIFMAGSKGNRILTPNTSILSHQYSWGAIGKEHELISSNKKFEMLSDKIVKHYVKCTGIATKTIKEKLLPPTDVWLSAEEALQFKLCDLIKDVK